MDEQVEAFLKELTALSKKHGIVIAGCGCCGSPYFVNLKETRWISEDGHYELLSKADDLTLTWVGDSGE